MGFIWDGPIKNGWHRKSMIWRFHRVKHMVSILGVLDGTKCTNSFRKSFMAALKNSLIEVVGQILWMNQTPNWIFSSLLYIIDVAMLNIAEIWGQYV